MSVYLLDTGIVLAFQKAKHLDALAAAATVVNIAVVEDVYDEIVTNVPPKHFAAAAEAKEVIGASRIAIHSLKVGSPEAATHEAIRAGRSSSTADLGESASIAWAVHNPAVILVTNDSAASLRALQELRGRTISFHPFLAILAEHGALPVDRCALIAGEIQKLKDWSAKEPVWWQSWLAARLVRGS